MKRIFAVFCAILATAALLLPVCALEPGYKVTEAYGTSTYYQNLLSLPLTGDAAHDTVAVAMTQLGYHEGNSTAQTHGANGSGSGNYTEFNYAYGKIGNTYSYAWCAAFVSWCLERTDSAQSAGGVFASCSLWVARLKDLGLYRTRASGYTPDTGDLIFFRSQGVTRASDHVGLVRYVSAGRVYTVEGNSSNCVTLHDYALSDTYITGYGTPTYGGEPSGVAVKNLTSSAPGYYTVTNATLNLRTGPGTSYGKAGQLQKGALVKITALQNGWGKTEINGKTCWLSLSYTCFTTPFSYHVSYLLGEKEVTRRTFSSHCTATLTEENPVQEGFRFLRWEDENGKAYQKGDVLPVKDLSLHAVFEELPPPVVSEPQVTPPVDVPEPVDTPPAAEHTPDAEHVPVAQETSGAEPVAEAEAAAPAKDTAAGAAAVICEMVSACLGALWFCRKIFP